ncbi:hypothetical protein [Dactylosporangium darangshiense]|uniref:hypothetical protein n=1 Tax=Dactylosporangium darangshiense TaxID=579108 RepID=UPI0036403DE7
MRCRRGGVLAYRILECLVGRRQLAVGYAQQPALLEAADGRLDEPGGQAGRGLDLARGAGTEHDGGEDLQAIGLGEQATQGCGSHKRRQYCQKVAIVG